MRPWSFVRRFHRDIAGATRAVTALLLGIAVLQLYLGAFVDHANSFGLGPGAALILGVTSAALTLISNALPSIFGTEPASPSGG